MLAGALFAPAPAHAITFTSSAVPVAGDGFGWPSGLGVGDFDEDGRADVAVALQSGELSILLRDPSGEYGHGPGSPHLLDEHGGGPLEVADVNGDGHADVLAYQSQPSSSTVAVLLGDGDGAFTPAPAVTAPGAYGTMALGDVDGDGKLDLVLAVETGLGSRLAVMRGVGDGTFGAPASVDVALDGAVPSAVALADFDGDGKLDAAVAHALVTVGVVTVLRGDGTGGFARAAGSPYAAGSGSLVLSAGDLDGDGRVDLVVSARSASGDNRSVTVAALLGDGDGTFRAGPPGSFVTPPALNPVSVFALPLGDLDGDGRLDAAMPLGETAGVWPLFGDGAGRLLSDAGALLPGAWSYNAGAIADLDGDGRLDILATSPLSPARVLMYVNDAEPAIAVSSSAAELGSRQVGDPPAGATVTVSNPGDHGLRVTGLAISGTDAADFGASGCTDRPIPAGQSCDLALSFAPRAPGARSATLTIASDAPGARETTVALSGTGTEPPGGGDGGGGSGGGGSGGGGSGGGSGGSGGGGGGGAGGGGSGGSGGGSDGSGAGGGAGGGSGSIGRATALRLTVRPARAALAPGRRLRLTVAVRNRGRAAVRGVSLCPRVGRALAAGRCVKLGRIGAGRTARRAIAVKLTRRARPGRRYVVRLVARAAGSRAIAARVVVTARR